MNIRFYVVLWALLFFVSGNVFAQKVQVGDANGDGQVNVADIVEIVNCILGRASEKFNDKAADVNGDGEVNVTDIVSVVSIILSSGDNSKEDMPVIDIYLQKGSKLGEEILPRFIAFIDKQMLAQISDPDHPEMMMFSYADENSNHDATLLVTEHNIFIMSHNPYLSSTFPEIALVVGDYDNYSSIAFANVNWDTQKVEIIPESTVYFDNPIFSRPTAARQRGYTEEFYIKQFMNFTENLGKELDKKKDMVDGLGHIASLLGQGNLMDGASKLLSRYLSLVTPSMKYILSSDSEILNQNEMLEEVVSGDLQGALTDDILDVVKSYILLAIPVSKEDVNSCLWTIKMMQKYMTSGEVEKKMEEPDGLIGDYINESGQAMSSIGKSFDKAIQTVNQTIGSATSDEGVKLTVSVSNITETSLQLSGTVSITESTYLSYQRVGFIVNGEDKPTKLNGSTLEPVTLTGLEPGTIYTISAYYIPMLSEKTFYSETITVATQGGDSSGWEGTAWQLEGTTTYDGETDPMTITFDFSKLKENIVSGSLDGESFNNVGCTYAVDNDGNLELKFTLTFYGNYGQYCKDDMTFKFIRIGANTAMATMYVSEYIHYPPEWHQYGYTDETITVTGQFQCTRIN